MKSSLYSAHVKCLACVALFVVACVSLHLPTAGTVAAGALKDHFKLTTVFLVRHAERAATPREDPPLVEAGIARSQALARVLGKAGIKVIYTSQFLRTKQTAEPLAKQIGIESIPIALKMSAKNPREVSQESVKEMAEKIYQRAGENALIVGHSNTIPEVIKALGGGVVPVVDEKEFDDLFVVTVYAEGKASVTHLKY
jgi:broad specificity phosphatase PhoE